MFNLDKDTRRILKLKAAMWENRNEERLISKAIAAYQDPQKENQLKGSITLFIDGKEVVVKNVPLIQRGDELFENLLLSVALEQVLKEMEEEVPREIDFEDLLR